MNGYTALANSYRKLMEQGKIKEEDAKREIAVYDFLGTCDQSDFYRMIDSSAFNDIIRIFCKKSMENANLNEKSIASVMKELEWLFDTKICREVCEE